MKSSKKTIVSLVLLFFTSIHFASAAETLWKQKNNPANYVSLEKIKDKEAEELALNHPYQIDSKTITDMLLSIRYNKALLFRKDIQDQKVFFDLDTLEKKFAPQIAEAFQKAAPNQMVVVSIVQKDPFFILRNDRLSVFKMFVDQEGMHVRFVKTDSQLSGDYQAQGTGAKLIQNAKGLKISLEPQTGQKLSFSDAQEIILDLKTDFAAIVDKNEADDAAQKKEEGKRSKRSEKVEANAKADSASVKTAATPVSAEPKKPATERLKELKKLKDQGLISNEDYEAKKKEILKDL